MIDSQLKKEWSSRAYTLCEKEHGKMFTPGKGAFSGYLGRLFNREELQNIGDNSLFYVVHFNEIRHQIRKDIDANKPSTSRVAEFTLKAYVKMGLEADRGVREPTQTPQSPSGRVPK